MYAGYEWDNGGDSKGGEIEENRHVVLIKSDVMFM